MSRGVLLPRSARRLRDRAGSRPLEGTDRFPHRRRLDHLVGHVRHSCRGRECHGHRAARCSACGEYDPTAGDLTKLSGADFVLYSDFEAFVPTLTDAADAELIAVNADNTPAKRQWRIILGDSFPTG